MKKTILTLGLTLIFAGMLTGCGQAETQPTEITTVPETTVAAPTETVPAETQAELPAEASFEDLEAILGMDDAQAAEVLGGGEENWSEDKSTFIGRIYRTTLREESVKVFTSYNSEDKVASVSVWVTDGTREVPEEEVQAWVQALTEYAGSDPIFDGTTSEAGSQNWKWKKDETFLTLHWLGDIVSIDMLPAIGELK